MRCGLRGGGSGCAVLKVVYRDVGEAKGVGGEVGGDGGSSCFDFFLLDVCVV
jgi:hypothetical protein